MNSFNISKPLKAVPFITLAALFCASVVFSEKGVKPAFAQLSSLAPKPKVSEFLRPVLAEQYKQISQLIGAGNLDDAEQRLRSLIGQVPFLGIPHLLQARIDMLKDNEAAALRSLEHVAKAGDVPPQVLEQFVGNFTFRDKGQVATILRSAGATFEQNRLSERKPVPMPVLNNQLMVSQSNVKWNDNLQMLNVFADFRSMKTPTGPVMQKNDPVAQKLNELFAQGLAAGNKGDLYDNRDRNHSRIFIEQFPQVTFSKYAAEAGQARLDYGFNQNILFNAITIGNSSTAINSGATSRSQARLPTTDQALMNGQYLHYSNNHLYLYPAVSDFSVSDGDRYLTNTPYLVITEGRSGSDRPFMNALFATLGAFQPAVKNQLRQSKRVVPTLQALLRQSQKSVSDLDSYLSAQAHPVVFNAQDLDVAKMVGLAQAMRLETIPPVLGLRVDRESLPRPGIDDFMAGYSEYLFNTPSAIARVIRASAYEKKMVLSVQADVDLTAPDVTIHWVVLNGDKERIKITAMQDNQSQVELTVPWHERRALAHRPDIETDRVEIAAFVQKGDVISAPAFVTFLYPAHQKRIYQDGRLVSIDHNDTSFKERYADPILFSTRSWKDTYIYDEAGSLQGWTRARPGQLKTDQSTFMANGQLILQKDGQGRPLRTQSVIYQRKVEANKPVKVIDTPIRTYKDYAY